jgi:hypothetical protein
VRGADPGAADVSPAGVRAGARGSRV